MNKKFYRVDFFNATPSRVFWSRTKATEYAKNKTAGHTFMAYVYECDMDGNSELLYTV